MTFKLFNDTKNLGVLSLRIKIFLSVSDFIPLIKHFCFFLLLVDQLFLISLWAIFYFKLKNKILKFSFWKILFDLFILLKIFRGILPFWKRRYISIKFNFVYVSEVLMLEDIDLLSQNVKNLLCNKKNRKCIKDRIFLLLCDILSKSANYDLRHQ